MNPKRKKLQYYNSDNTSPSPKANKPSNSFIWRAQLITPKVFFFSNSDIICHEAILTYFLGNHLSG